MAPYIRRPRRAQLWFILLTFALVSLPLGGSDSTPASPLVPLATRLVPLGPVAEVPATFRVHLPDLTAATKLFIGRPTAANMEPASQNRLQIPATTLDLQSGALDIFRTRAPPAA
jgi:hypothetical protein